MDYDSYKELETDSFESQTEREYLEEDVLAEEHE